MKPSEVYFSAGSNTGNPAMNCDRVFSVLSEGCPAVRLVEKSPLYLTSPEEIAEQPWFVNACGKLETFLEPFKLLRYFKEIEAGFGRDFSSMRFGPRVIDLDILFYDNIVFNTPELVIPHTKMNVRRFVLKPLSDIAPLLKHPVTGKSVSAMLDETDGDRQTVLLYDSFIKNSRDIHS